MSKTVRIFNHQYPLIPFISTLLGIVMLTMLGNWQLKRLEEKSRLISAIEQSMITPAQLVTADNIKNVEIFQKIKLEGSFIEGQNIFLYGKRSGTAEKDGYYILSPFIVDNQQGQENSEIILVSRGWIPQSMKATIADGTLSFANSMQSIEVVVMPREKKPLFMPENDLERNIWFRIDPEFAVGTHNVTIGNVYFRQINASDLPDGMVPLSTSNLSKVRNDHLEYAISWYGLAVALIIMFLYYYHGSATDASFR